MAKSKNVLFWITRDKKTKSLVVKGLTWKDVEKGTEIIACKFYWDNEESANNYLSYLITRKGLE